MRLTRHERGDTIIEVMFAVVVFSFVAVSGIVIMNQGISISQKALEITLVRQQVNAQAEALRYIHQLKVTADPTASGLVWDAIASGYYQEKASTFGADSTDTVNGISCAIPSSGFSPFILNARTATLGSTPKAASTKGDTPPFSQVDYDEDGNIDEAYGIWIEAVRSPELTVAPNRPRFIDFHIRACWPSPDSEVPMTIGTIVRLYDPVKS